MKRLLIAIAVTFAAFAAPAYAAQQDFTVTNHTGHVIVTLQVSPADSTHWGPDILGREVLADGEKANVTFPRTEDQCVWDIRVTYDDRTENDERGINLCETTEVEFTASE